jgi:hypothetical protein
MKHLVGWGYLPVTMANEPQNGGQVSNSTQDRFEIRLDGGIFTRRSRSTTKNIGLQGATTTAQGGNGRDLRIGLDDRAYSTMDGWMDGCQLAGRRIISFQKKLGDWDSSCSLSHLPLGDTMGQEGYHNGDSDWRRIHSSVEIEI